MNQTQLKADPNLIGKLISVEIEYYPTAGANDISTTASSSPNELINVANDVSVPGGKEIRVLALTDNAERIKAITSLDIKGGVDKRCGLHVHIDARHLGSLYNGVQLLSVEQTYDRLVSAGMTFCFKKLVPQSRITGPYMRFCQWKNNRNFGVNRQCAINFQSFRKHGTIEFRMQGGSTNPHKIEMWSLVCRFWLNYAAVESNVMPTSWSTFIEKMPIELRTWCMLRRAKLYKTLFGSTCEVQLNSRVMASLVDGIGE